MDLGAGDLLEYIERGFPPGSIKGYNNYLLEQRDNYWLVRSLNNTYCLTIETESVQQKLRCHIPKECEYITLNQDYPHKLGVEATFSIRGREYSHHDMLQGRWEYDRHRGQQAVSTVRAGGLVHDRYFYNEYMCDTQVSVSRERSPERLYDWKYHMERYMDAEAYAAGAQPPKEKSRKEKLAETRSSRLARLWKDKYAVTGVKPFFTRLKTNT